MAKKKPAPRSKPAKSSTRPKGKVNKAEAIREAANDMGKKARPKDIIAALAAKGITVTSPQVSMTLKAAGLRKGKQKKGGASSNSRNGQGTVLNIEDVIQVKELAAKMGGVERLKETIQVYEQLQRIWYAV